MKVRGGVLRDNGGSWDSPPATVIWSDERSRALTVHIALTTLVRATTSLRAGRRNVRAMGGGY
jgi:hypothetical protein